MIRVGTSAAQWILLRAMCSARSCELPVHAQRIRACGLDNYGPICVAGVPFAFGGTLALYTTGARFHGLVPLALLRFCDLSNKAEPPLSIGTCLVEPAGLRQRQGRARSATLLFVARRAHGEHAGGHDSWQTRLMYCGHVFERDGSACGISRFALLPLRRSGACAACCECSRPASRVMSSATNIARRPGV